MQDLHARLMQEHGELDAVLGELVHAFQTDDRELATAAFARFDRQLTAHLAFEDAVLIPALAATDPEPAAQIAREHREIRARVDQLGVADDLHLSRASAVRELVELLRAHARREDAVLYPLARDAAREPEAAFFPPTA